MIKVVVLLKKKSGMTDEDFVKYYESTHSKLGERVLPTAERYFRRYLTPYPTPQPEQGQESEYDAITEIWYQDRATFEASMTSLTEPVIAKEIAEDEENLFDRSKIRIFTVEEHESQLGSSVEKT